jgi:hypothetical protein
MSDKTEKYDQYGRPYDNPTDLASADALARRYVNGELPMPNQIQQVDADESEVVADYQERWERIIDQDALELELLRRNPTTSYPRR